MIQDIFPQKYDNNYYGDREPKERSVCFVFQNNMVLVGHMPEDETDAGQRTGGYHKEIKKRYIPAESCSSLEREIPEGDIYFPVYGELKEQVRRIRYLFAIGGEEYYLAELDTKEEPAGFHYEHYKAHRHSRPKYRVFAQMTAYHLYCWYRDNTFCGRCGKKTGHDKVLRALRCKECGNLVFPRIAPAVIVGVHDGRRLLMTKYSGRDYTGYALIAGFIEIGESAEDAVRREVMEEVGVHVKNIAYYGSQPWGMDCDFLLGYYAELEGAAGIHLDEKELSMAAWYTPEEITVEDDDVSITSRMIANWKRSHMK